MPIQANFCGVDEAGRGALAGPVVAACVLFNQKVEKTLIKDSKVLKKKQREAAFHYLKTRVIWRVGLASVKEIDQLNILAATMIAMQRAISRLPIQPDFALIDGDQTPDRYLLQHTLPLFANNTQKRSVRLELIRYRNIVKGDQKSMLIGAASIIAKVVRDALMHSLSLDHSGYGFEQHKGYGTQGHLRRLKSMGISPLHRISFSPCKSIS